MYFKTKVTINIVSNQGGTFMKNIFKLRKRCLSKVVAGVLSVSLLMSGSVYAAEPSENSNVLTIEEAGISREEAIEMFDLTEEEAERANFYVLEDGDTVSGIQPLSAIDSNNPYDSNYFSFSGSNTGSYRTMNGNKMKFRMLWKPNPGDGSEACQVYLHPYGQSYKWQYLFTLASPICSSDSSYRDITSDWINIIYGLDYNFIYWSYTGHGGGNCPDHRCTMRVIIVVV